MATYKKTPRNIIHLYVISTKIYIFEITINNIKLKKFNFEYKLMANAVGKQLESPTKDIDPLSSSH